VQVGVLDRLGSLDERLLKRSRVAALDRWLRGYWGIPVVMVAVALFFTTILVLTGDYASALLTILLVALPAVLGGVVRWRVEVRRRS
jgi:hypothetical protein